MRSYDWLDAIPDTPPSCPSALRAAHERVIAALDRFRAEERAALRRQLEHERMIATDADYARWHQRIERDHQHDHEMQRLADECGLSI